MRVTGSIEGHAGEMDGNNYEWMRDRQVDDERESATMPR